MTNKKKLTINVFMIFTIMGLSKVIIGPSLPDMISGYGVSLTVAGSILGFLSFGRFISVLSATAILDNNQYKPVLVTGTVLITAGLTGNAISGFWWGHLLSVLIIGFGIGLVGSCNNVLITDLYSENRGNFLNLSHMFFGVGAVVGPLLAGVYLNQNISWRWIYLTVAFLSLGVLIYTILGKFPEKNIKIDYENRTAVRWKKLINSREFFLLAMVMFIYVGVGNSIFGWVNKYLGDTFSFSAFAASGVLLIYNLGLTGGRLGYSFITEYFGYKKTIMICSIGGLVSVSTAVLTGIPVLIIICFGLTGLFLSGLFPVSIAFGSRLFPEMVGTISAALIAAAALGGTVVPWFLGFVSDYLGLQGGMMVNIAVSLLLVVVASLLPEEIKPDTVVRPESSLN
ncbi:MAG: MFS transporter [Halanaerobiales bacterium]